MASDAEIRRLNFIKAYNSTVGAKTGRSLKFNTDDQIAKQIPAINAERASMMMMETLAAKKALNATPKKKSTSKTPTGATSAADILKMLGEDVPKVTAKGTVKTSAGGLGGGGKEIKLDFKKFKAGGDASGIAGLWNKIDEAVTNNPVTDKLQDNPITRFGGNALVGALDHISRPGYAVVSAMDRMSNDDVGNNPFKMAVAGFHGGWAGLAGKSKVGFGALIHIGSLDSGKFFGGILFIENSTCTL